MLGVDAIREFRVFTNTYNAGVRRNSGSIVQMITKAGTNSLHGSAFEFIRNAKLDAKNYSICKVSPFRRSFETNSAQPWWGS